MVTARREHFGYLLEPGLRKIFYETYDQIPTMLPDLFNMQTTSNPYETDVSIGTMGAFPKFEGTVEYDRPYQGYKKTYEFPEFAHGFRIERKLFDDDRYNEINKQPAGLAIGAARRREEDGSNIFNNAFNTNFTGGDGKALCVTDHPSQSGGADRSNKGTTALSHASLQDTKNLMRAFVDDRGGKISVVPDTLLVPVALEETAWELIESAKKIDTAENNPNIHYGKYKLIVWDYLTDDSNWFLLDSRYARLFLNWFDRIPLEFAMEEDFDTFVAKYRAYMRYESGWSDWIWIYGHEVA